VIQPGDVTPETPGNGPGGDNLALLYQGMLTGIVRIQAGKQPIGDPKSFQRRMEDLLAEIQREAIKIGYRQQEIDDAHFAVIAFLDETVLSSRDPSRLHWSSLGAKVYQQAIAGDAIFDRLKNVRSQRDSPALADVLELYYLCFVLGYEGRYAVVERSELSVLMSELRDRIERIRNRSDALSPEGGLPPKQARSTNLDPWVRPLAIVAVSSAALAGLAWIVLKLLLNSSAAAVAVQ